jgi:cell division protein FtsW
MGPLSLQPSELAKLALILFLAWRLQRDRDPDQGWQKTFIPCLVLSGFFVFLVMMQPDLGTAVSLAILAGSMLFVAGVRLRFLAGIAVLGLAVLLVLVPMKGYQMRRVTAFLDPASDPQGAGYQVRQSVISVGAGGETGRGLGEGRQKLFFLPYPYTDFVYAVIGEELGLIGTLAVMGAFLVLMWRGLRAAARAPDMFGCYLAAGTTIFLVAQAMINIGVALGMLPAKGLPLPFISYGGSSLVAGLAASGILLNVSQYSH